MKVFLAGATGAIGRQLVPLFRQHGHDVTAMVRGTKGRDMAAAMGARVVEADALDADAVKRAVAAARPHVVVHEMTAIPDDIDLRHLDRDFAATNALRTTGTDNLIAAATAAGARRFVAQSFVGWTYDPSGGPVKTEDAPLMRSPPASVAGTLAGIRHVEGRTLAAPGMQGLVLRYGTFYGPGTGFAPGTSMMQLVRKRRLPVVGGGTGVWSFVHVADAAAATARAVEAGEPGVYNIVDDEPAGVAEWLPHLADVCGAPAPMRIPSWLGRLAVGPFGVHMVTTNRGASNAKAKASLGWAPRYASWREGFRAALGGVPAPATETAIREAS